MVHDHDFSKTKEKDKTKFESAMISFPKYFTMKIDNTSALLLALFAPPFATTDATTPDPYYASETSPSPTPAVTGDVSALSSVSPPTPMPYPYTSFMEVCDENLKTFEDCKALCEKFL
jgi:hypothetical protein